MVKIKYSKRTQPIALKKTVCVILPKLDYNEFLRERRRRSLSTASSYRGDSPKITAVIKPNKRRLRVKKEPPCQFHSEIDLSENVVEEIPGVLSEPLNNSGTVCLHDVTRSMCYMCSPVPEDKHEIWTEIRNLDTITAPSATSNASVSEVNQPRNEIRNWHTPVNTATVSTSTSSSNVVEPRNEIPNWHTPVATATSTPSLLHSIEPEIVESQERATVSHYIDAAITPEESNLFAPRPATIDKATQTVRHFSCKYCPALFSDVAHLIHHKSVHQKMLECVFCSAHFIAKNSLKSHLKLHMQPKYYECVFCTQTFTKKHDIKLHLALHIEEKSFQCLTCSARFTQRTDLRVHEKSHSSVHKFIHIFKKFDDDAVVESQVPSIPPSASSNSPLKSISSVSENNKGNVPTPISSAKSSTGTLATVPPVPLNSTVTTLTPNRTLNFYSCENCPLSFKTLATYRNHKKCHTRNAGKFSCENCGGRFMSKFGLSKHKNFAHK